MLALGMLGEGRPVYRSQINTNRNQWTFVSDGPSVPNVPIDFYLTIAAGVTVESNTFVPAIKLFSLPTGSHCFVENRGSIVGWDTGLLAKSSEIGCGIQANWNSGRLFITNSAGFIYAGDCSDGAGYAVYMAGSPKSVLQWVSGSSRIYGTVST